MLEKKNVLYKKYIASKTPHAKNNCNEIRNKYFHLIEIKKQNFYKQLLFTQKYNIKKKTWKVINSILGKTKADLCKKLIIDGEEIEEDQTTADSFNIILQLYISEVS